jgi:L-alanine-DL-glutamate epimerase-like enolase superfamily enzyme
MVDGFIRLPTQPGLGVELNLDALAAYSAEADRVARAYAPAL